jgi:diaminohydroxyphosphoribosylaminopyrimidine deaminase/5-amino-6-(5-phosphoribosylamino)uracil reductase
VTLEPCSTFGRTPPCVEAIIASGIARVVIAAVDPNPKHSGRGIGLLRKAKIKVTTGVSAEEATTLNEVFNHWILTRQPWITLKAALSLDGKIATAAGESKWISSPFSREHAMRLRFESDAILVGINTVLRDNPSLTLRGKKRIPSWKKIKRIVLDRRAQTPLDSALLSDDHAGSTIIVTTSEAPARKVRALEARARVLEAPLRKGSIDLRWLCRALGREEITHILVEGGGETHARFLGRGLGNRLAFFYAPMVIGGRESPRVVAGLDLHPHIRLRDVVWRKFGPDVFLTACLGGRGH